MVGVARIFKAARRRVVELGRQRFADIAIARMSVDARRYIKPRARINPVQAAAMAHDADRAEAGRALLQRRGGHRRTLLDAPNAPNTAMPPNARMRNVFM